MKKFSIIITILNFMDISYSQNWNFQIFNTSNSSIPSNDVTSITLDSKKQLWIGTTDGIGKYSNEQWSSVKDFNGGLLKIWSTGDSIWTGTEFDGLWMFSNNQWLDYDPNSIGNGILGFAIGKNDTIFRLDKFENFEKWSGNSWIDILSFVDDPEFLYSDSKKNIWVGSGNMGLYKYNNGNLFQFVNNIIDTTAANYIPAYDLRCMVEDKDSNLWIGTGDVGLLRYNGNKWEKIATPSNAKVLDINIDNNNAIWLGTDNGIMRYFNGEWLSFNSSNSSLPDNRVVSIISENENKIWAAVGYNDMYSPPGGKGIVCLTSEFTGIKTNSRIDYQIYPNPTSSSIFVDFNNTSFKEMKISITNLNGKILYFNCLRNTISNLRIDMNDYPNGVYLINIQSENITFMDKIIKMN
jgi:Secretion system C-terminal sorting domain/Two component regulator propeller